MTLRKSNLLPLLLMSGLPMAAIAGGGTVVKVDGTAVIERKQLKVAVAEATPVYSGDLLNVADLAVAQVRFEDDSVFVIPGAARLRVDTFTMPRAGTGGKAIYTLVDGGVRTITGSVSKGDKGQYELRTEEATITVSGSAYMALRCQGACATKHRAGLYVKGEDGTITVSNAGGKVRVARGQTIYVAGSQALPQHVRTSPFEDAAVSARFGIAAEFDADAHPARIEQEPAASPY